MTSVSSMVATALHVVRDSLKSCPDCLLSLISQGWIKFISFINGLNLMSILFSAWYSKHRLCTGDSNHENIIILK